MVNEATIRIFLASPGDTEEERETWRDCIDAFNASLKPGKPRMELREWRAVRGTARRPQEAINELIEECHYMAVMFKSKWGSSPGGQWGYTSGTEEELFMGLLALGTAEAPMRDVWVGFGDVDSRESSVLELRQQIMEKSALFFDSWSSLDALRSMVKQLLNAWSGPLGAKESRYVDLLPSSGRPIIEAAARAHEGEQLIALGYPDKGLSKLAEAARLGGPAETERYARQLRHSGNLEGAQTAINKAIDVIERSNHLGSHFVASVFAESARILQAKGDDGIAITQLQTALRLISQNDPPSKAARARILDDLGLAWHRMGQLDAAMDRFGEALEIRKKLANPRDLAQSYVNMARIAVKKGDLKGARRSAEEAQRLLYSVAAPSLSANVYLLIAQISIREDRALEGLESATVSRKLNAQISHRKGEAMALLLMAQSCARLGRGTEARKYAEECYDLNSALGNEYGCRRANQVLNGLHGAFGL